MDDRKKPFVQNRSSAKPSDVPGASPRIKQPEAAATERKPESDEVRALARRIAALEKELAETRKTSQDTIRELIRANNQGPVSPLDDMQEVNEELRAANEEMQASREEMQAQSEELDNINAQLKARIRELEAANDDLDNIFSSTNIPTLFLDRALNVRMFTKATTRLTDLLPTDIGRPLAGMMQRQLGDDLLADAHAVLDGLVPSARDMPLGKAFYMRSALPYRTCGNRIEGVVVTYFDITAHRQTEDALRESEKRFRFIAEKIPVGIGIARMSDSVIVFANLEYHRMFGFPQGELIGQKVKDFYDDPADRERALHVMMEQGYLNDYVFKLRKSDGGVFWASLTGYITEYNGEQACIVAAIDITERIKADATLRGQAEKLLVANQNLESFSYSIAHDLRNPLNSILGCGEVLKDSIPSEDKNGKQALEYIIRSANRMSAVITDLMSLAKITNQEVRFTKCDLSAMAQALAEELSTLAPQRNAEWRIASGLTAEADEGLVWLLLQNLLNNAWKFSSKKTDACIEFGKMDEEEPPIYFVRDNGAGFDMAKAKRLFEPFQRFHVGKDYSGTGIGLSIVKRIVEKHGGRVWVEAEKDRGATFLFRLAAAYPPPPPLPLVNGEGQV